MQGPAQRLRASSARALSALLLTGLGCSAFSPGVGPEQDSCGLDAGVGATSGAGGYGSGAGTPGAASGSPIPICALDAGEACDDCESQFCCPTRLACYQDPVCACADRALDRCEDVAGDDPSRMGGCVAAFQAEGTVEEARLACQRTWCATECTVP